VSNLQYVLKHQKTGKTYPVSKPIVIGRDKSDLKFLSDEKLSRSHCKVYVDPAFALCVDDLGSTNKTWINEAALESSSTVKLKKGDRLRVGHQEFLVEEVDISAVTPVKVSKGATKQPAEATIQASRQGKTTRITLENSKLKQVVLWGILVVVGTLLVLMFLYPEQATQYIQSLSGR